MLINGIIVKNARNDIGLILGELILFKNSYLPIYALDNNLEVGNRPDLKIIELYEYIENDYYITGLDDLIKLQEHFYTNDNCFKLIWRNN